MAVPQSIANRLLITRSRSAPLSAPQMLQNSCPRSVWSPRPLEGIQQRCPVCRCASWGKSPNGELAPPADLEAVECLADHGARDAAALWKICVLVDRQQGAEGSLV